MSTPFGFVPTDAVRQILHGSYEHLVARLDEAVQGERERIFGTKDVPVRVLGTFPGSAVIATVDGRFARVRFEEQKGGVIKVVAHEPVNLPVVTEQNLDAFIKKESEDVVEEMLHGNPARAAAKLRGLVPFMEGRTQVSPKQVTESLVVAAHAPRAWKRLYQEQGPQIRRFLWDDLAKLESNRLRPQFKTLYDGTIPEAKLESYRDLVATRLHELAERAGRLADVVEASAKQALSLESSFRGLGEDTVLGIFESFSEDVVSDLRGMQSIIDEGMKRLGCVSCLGELYDALVSEMYDYEVAGRFVERMAVKLRDSQ